MCELLGMTANVPTDICFSFSGLMLRGGRTGPHKDGWGVAFYEGKAVREFREAHSSWDSEIAELVKSFPIKSKIIISHIRQANSGKVCLENTHPFVREMWGRNFTFAHNGQLKGIKKYPLSGFKPIGSTDSEYAFCWLMSRLRQRFPSPPSKPQTLWREMARLCAQLNTLGVFNLLFSDSQYLYCFCSTKLHWLTRQAPFSHAELKDAEIGVDFKNETQPDDVVTVIATAPLTENESWVQMDAGDFLVFKDGLRVFSN